MSTELLDPRGEIDLDGILRTWSQYAVADFRENIDAIVYLIRTNKKGVQRSALGKGYAFGQGRGASRLKRTNTLRNNWWQSSNSGAVLLEFMLYGRFLDMGVGRGTSHTDRLVSRQLREGSPGRQRKPWYAKKKSYEIKRLREILAEKGVQVPLDFVENALTLSLTRNL